MDGGQKSFRTCSFQFCKTETHSPFKEPYDISHINEFSLGVSTKNLYPLDFCRRSWFFLGQCCTMRHRCCECLWQCWTLGASLAISGRLEVRFLDDAVDGTQKSGGRKPRLVVLHQLIVSVVESPLFYDGF